MNPLIVTIIIALATFIISIFGASWLNQQAMNKRIDDLRSYLDAKLDAKFEAVDAQFDAVRAEIKGVEHKVGNIESRVDRIERQLSELAKVFGKKLRQGNAGKGMEALSRRCYSLAAILLLTVFLQKTFGNSLSQPRIIN